MPPHLDAGMVQRPKRTGGEGAQRPLSASDSGSHEISAESHDASPRSRRGGRPLPAGGPHDDDFVDSDADDFGSKKRKPRPSVCFQGALQGRFSGRLVSKQDEARLVEECQRLGPLLGGSTGGNPERERTQLSQIVRAIASGEVRDYLQQRAENQEWLAQELQAKMAAVAVRDQELRQQRHMVESLQRQLHLLQMAGDTTETARLQAFPQQQGFSQQGLRGDAPSDWTTSPSQQMAQRPQRSGASGGISIAAEGKSNSHPISRPHLLGPKAETGTQLLSNTPGRRPSFQGGAQFPPVQVQAQPYLSTDRLPDHHSLSQQLAAAQGGSSRVRSRSLDLSRPPPPGASTDWVTAHIAAQGTHHSSDVSSLVTASSQHLGCHPSPSGSPGRVATGEQPGRSAGDGVNPMRHTSLNGTALGTSPSSVQHMTLNTEPLPMGSIGGMRHAPPLQRGREGTHTPQQRHTKRRSVNMPSSLSGATSPGGGSVRSGNATYDLPPWPSRPDFLSDSGLARSGLADNPMGGFFDAMDEPHPQPQHLPGRQQHDAHQTQQLPPQQQQQQQPQQQPQQQQQLGLQQLGWEHEPGQQGSAQARLHELVQRENQHLQQMHQAQQRHQAQLLHSRQQQQHQSHQQAEQQQRQHEQQRRDDLQRQQRQEQHHLQHQQDQRLRQHQQLHLPVTANAPALNSGSGPAAQQQAQQVETVLPGSWGATALGRSSDPGHEGGLSYVEDRLNRGDGMVWSTNGMAPAHNMPPPGYGAMAMGLLPPGFMRPDQAYSESAATTGSGRGPSVNGGSLLEGDFMRGSGGEGSGRADLGGPILDGALFSVPMAAGRGPNQQQEDLSLLGVDPLLLAGAVPEPASMDLGWSIFELPGSNVCN